jgi:hypothetical protein
VLSLVAWAQEASVRLGRGLGVGVSRRVVSVFGQFSLLTGHSLLLNEKAELLLIALKKTICWETFFYAPRLAIVIGKGFTLQPYVRWICLVWMLFVPA